MNELKCNTVGMVETTCELRKHQDLHSAIRDSESIQIRLESLIERIQGAESDEVKPCDANPQGSSLQDVLWNGASNLRDQLNLSHDAISRLEDILF